MHHLTLLILPAVAALVAIAAPLRAADWPSRPVTVVVPFAAGGNTDMMARLGAQQLSAKFGQTFVVENRPSAGGALGTGVVAAAAKTRSARCPQFMSLAPMSKASVTKSRFHAVPVAAGKKTT